jgi:drug/metabolite transporter (DMT)-like permease
MLLAALCSAFYSVWSRPLIERSAAVPYTVVGMMVGVSVLAIISWSRGSADVISTFDSKHWIAVAFLSMPAGALAFYLWAFALARTTPTRVAITMTLNPIAAAIFGVFALDEPISWNLVLGLLMVLAGICLSASGPIAPQPSARSG